MPPLVIPPGFATAKIRYTLTGDPEEMITTLGVELDSGGDALACANAIFGAWKIDFCVSGLGLASNWTVLGVDLQLGNDPPPGVVVRSNTSALVGELVAQTLPQNCAILGQKRTAVPGRRGRGRMFVPCAHVGEGDINGAGVISGLALDVLQTRMDAFVESLTDGPIVTPPVLFHSESPTVPTPIDQITIAAVIATQRQRLRR